nr:MAG TPA: hypothetical protein [Crassvirales sp.]
MTQDVLTYGFILTLFFGLYYLPSVVIILIMEILLVIV